jgi:hypothetical protein
VVAYKNRGREATATNGPYEISILLPLRAGNLWAEALIRASVKIK